MKNYSTIQQIEILTSCNNCVELLEAKERITETQVFSSSAVKVYDRLMLSFLAQNLISN